MKKKCFPPRLGKKRESNARLARYPQVSRVKPGRDLMKVFFFFSRKRGVEKRQDLELHYADLEVCLSLGFSLAFALPILQDCLTAAHPIKALVRIDLQPLLTLMQMSAREPMRIELGAGGGGT